MDRAWYIPGRQLVSFVFLPGSEPVNTVNVATYMRPVPLGSTIQLVSHTLRMLLALHAAYASRKLIFCRKNILDALKNRRRPNQHPEGMVILDSKDIRPYLATSFCHITYVITCLLSARQLHYNTISAAPIVNACCVLHNIANKARLDVQPLTFNEVAAELAADVEVCSLETRIDCNRRQNQELLDGRAVQQSLVNHLFLANPTSRSSSHLRASTAPTLRGAGVGGLPRPSTTSRLLSCQQSNVRAGVGGLPGEYDSRLLSCPAVPRCVLTDIALAVSRTFASTALRAGAGGGRTARPSTTAALFELPAVPCAYSLI
ncbi:unnamed protein product [Trichogramma brassicae]|uniref:DDE Tnp4 domain-containing protein n=1 Tax=Trichogramma brassicae TaxID=86971 RepID=A0A6H5J3V0_9HYME|nr:unnamed protein product [Trichogramma brassicae]